MKTHRSIYMVARQRGDGYRQVTRGEAVKLQDAGTAWLEGVDGDCIENTVTYYLSRERPEPY